MPIGNSDTQFDLSWQELDKVKRRQELKRRLKFEGIRKLYDPYLQIKKEIFSDPAIERYQDLRKRGRMPGAPMNPRIYFTIMGTVLIPIIVLAKAMEWERAPFLAGCASGDITYEERIGKATV